MTWLDEMLVLAARELVHLSAPVQCHRNIMHSLLPPQNRGVCNSLGRELSGPKRRPAQGQMLAWLVYSKRREGYVVATRCLTKHWRR